jgi:predicted XRE-type DNA-binding protein
MSKRTTVPTTAPATRPTSSTFADAFGALASTPEEAANLRAWADLMDALSAMVAAEGWTQTEAARRCGVTQPRMNDMLRGRISRFSLDALVNMAATSGRQVHIERVAA